jgi:agmatinase
MMMPKPIASTAVIFPFDLHGSAGTAAGAQLLGDALTEVIDDTLDEPGTVRQQVFVEQMIVDEVPLETVEELSRWREHGRRAFEKYRDTFLIWLSGNHLGTLPVYEALPAETLVLQFDAHLDIQAHHDTMDTLSHGNFLRMHPPQARVVNIGHRDLFLPPKAITKSFHAAYSSTETIPNSALAAKSIWIDIDVDVFDPAVCPAVHDPEPFGFTGREMLAILERINFKTVRGVSISEFDPKLDIRDASLNLLGWLLEWMLLRKFESNS